jgi:ankyrin repeat protein
LIFVDEDFRN